MLTLVLLTGLSVLSLNMFLPSLAQMATGFGVNYALISLAVGGYLAVSAVLQIIMGPLSDRYGRRPVVLIGLGLFTLASVGCYFATDFRVFMVFRMLQAGIAAGMALSRAVVRDVAPASEAARLLGVMGTAMALAPLLGPMLGGLLDELFGWRANFAAFAIMGALLLVICWYDLQETNLEPSASFTAQFRTYPDLAKSKLFWAYSVCLVFSVGGFFAFLGGAALVGEGLFGLTPAQLGIGMGSISGGFMLGNIVTGRMSGRYRPVSLMIAGRLFASFGPLLAIAVLALGWFNPYVLFGGAIFVGLGNGLTLPSANAGVMSVNPRLAGSASGLSGALTVLGGAVATALTGALAGGPSGAYVLLGFMSLTSFVGLIAALWVRQLEAAQ
ncbi:MFS transporter [Lentibacter algarum]|uniref:MFS transporter n=1 Tax=Lentibacter algarum TaxID=576131 RepID=UPI0020908946|nr:MFS transporter [Lentibacter algarum]